jgi:pimeloyl-ACP methyl ester carboxylesterase
MSTHNKRLTPDLALHLATHGVRQNTDGTYSWKFDPYQRATVPHRLWPDDYIALWSRITCPTLLLGADESFLGDPKANGVVDHFKQASAETVAGAGHWLHHDKPDEVLGLVRSFLGLPEETASE